MISSLYSSQSPSTIAVLCARSAIVFTMSQKLVTCSCLNDTEWPLIFFALRVHPSFDILVKLIEKIKTLFSTPSEVNPQHHRLQWGDEMFTGHPYIVLKAVRYECHHGPDRNAAKKEKAKNKVVCQSTKTMYNYHNNQKCSCEVFWSLDSMKYSLTPLLVQMPLKSQLRFSPMQQYTYEKWILWMQFIHTVLHETSKYFILSIIQ